ncbi:Ig-like domain-containing protein [Pontibacter toksunensis]
MLLLSIGCVLKLQAQTNAKLKVGKASEVKAKFEAKAKGKQAKGTHAQLSQKVTQGQLVLNLKRSRKEGTADIFYGDVENTKDGTFYLKIVGNDVSGSIILKEQKKYYDYSSSSDGSVYLVEKDIDKILCIEYQESPDKVATSDMPGGTAVAAVPGLESLPGAEAVVLLDFDGQTVGNTLWNSRFTYGEPIVAAPAFLTDAEMVAVWKMVSEDFRPFALNVTTNEAVFNRAPATSRMRVIFTPTNYFYPNAGGAAYVNSFTFASTHGETPAFVWNGSIKGAGEAGSHEIGHTLGLSHDGRSNPYIEEYYYGHEEWAPIMGVGYYSSVVQWSKGEYPYASNTQDDLQIITTQNGFGYRGDDHGNTRENASPLTVAGSGQVSPSVNKGVVATRTDVDVFSFTTSGGRVILQAEPDPSYPNLDILLTLKNSTGATVSTANPSTLAASFDQTLAAGTYYLEIDGSKGDLGANSDYASLGEYFVSGTVPSNVSPIVSLTSPTNGQRFTAPATIHMAADASDAGGSVTKVEFFNGSIKLGEDLNAPYTYNWGGVAAGSYTITAKATDNLGATTTSAPVAVRVDGNSPPIVQITSPGNNHTLTIPQNPIHITVNASDADGRVAKVEFFNGSTKLGEDFSAPYTYSWRQPHTGIYYITALATDNTGAKTVSDAIKVTVVKPGKGNMKAISKAKLAAAATDEELAEPVIYPNPVTGDNMVNINLPAYNAEASIMLHELSTGRKLFERSYSNRQAVQLDVSDLPRGVYSLTIVAEGRMWTKKLVVMP